MVGVILFSEMLLFVVILISTSIGTDVVNALCEWVSWLYGCMVVWLYVFFQLFYGVDWR